MTHTLLPPYVLQAVLDQLAESVLITDAEGRILYVNAAFEALTGYGREEVLGKNPRILKSGRHPQEFYERFWAQLLEGRAFRGYFVNRRKDGSLYTEEKVVTPIRDASGRTQYLVATSRDVTEELALRERLQELATLDPLTGLLNRRAFEEAVERAIQSTGQGHALAYLDLDRFKAVNDALGHLDGDRVLREVAQRLRRALPQGLLGRLGGDEFAAWFPAHNPLEAQAKARALLEACALEVDLGTGRVRLEASLGIALYPSHGMHYGELVRRADLAMYRAKAGRLREPVVFTPDLEGLTPQALILEAEFHRALATGQAALFFQGLKRVGEEGFRDVEVLFRLRKGETYVNPLPRMDLSRRAVNEALDRFVVRQLRELQTRYPHLTFWVNLTPWGLGDKGFLDLVEREVQAGLDPQRVVLEVSEALALAQIGRIAPGLWKLKSMGFRLALDDFGAGQTSLAHLSRLPLDYLKLDPHLLAFPRDRKETVLRHIVDMAHEMGLEVVLEGLEREEDWELAQTLGVNLAQGFFLHRPEEKPA
jgi:diguanylate cyclase (GGDEF)-like protein/PAS domain S-box-containing protein